MAGVLRDKIQARVYDRDRIYCSLDTSLELHPLSLSPTDTVWTGFITEEFHLDKITSGPLFLLPLSCVKLWLCPQQFQFQFYL